MKKVAVFGNTGAGKSTLSKKLAEITDLPLYALDKIQYKSGGEEVKYQDYRQIHNQILKSDKWIIDGYGCKDTLWSRLKAADTLIYIDLPLFIHFVWVSKRLIKGLFNNPEGWPENSPVFKSSFNSYRTLIVCHRVLTPKYREYVGQTDEVKNIYHLKSIKSIAQFIAEIEHKNVKFRSTR
ncbi:MAG: adenylate kinase [Pleurocapsa sp.]